MGWALLVGTGLLLLGVVFYAIASAATLRILAALHLRGRREVGFGKTVVVLTVTALVACATHVFQVSLWAVALLAFGEASGFGDALYRSAANYATLGGADAKGSDHWRLLGPLEAVNGVLLLGLSTALMFTVMGRLVEGRPKLRLDAPNSAAEPDLARLSGG